MDVEHTSDGGSGMIDESVLVDFTSSEADTNTEPYEGMIFDSEAAARTYYDEYAGRTGFLTRILSSRKSERDGSIISRGIGCRNILNNQKSNNISNEVGEKRRDGCTAMILVKRESGGKWVVRKFVRDHNHPLAVSMSKRPTFDERDKRIQELTAELRVKRRLSAAYREQLLVLLKDVENHNDHLTSKVHTIRNNIKEFDQARKQELSDHNKPSI